MGKNKLNINKMKPIEIYNELAQMIYGQDIPYIVKDFNALMRGLNKENIDADELDVEGFLESNAEMINKEKLVYVSAMRLKKWGANGSIEKLGDFQKKTYQASKKLYEIALEAIKNNKIEIPKIIEKDGLFEIDRFYDMDYLKGIRKEKDYSIRSQNFEIWDRIEEKVSINAMFAVGIPNDFQEFYAKNRETGSFFQYMISRNTEKILSDENLEKPNEQIELKQEKDVFKTYIEKMDMNNFLLISAYRAKSILESKKFPKDTEMLFIKVMRVANEVIEENIQMGLCNYKAKISGNMILNDYSGREYIEYSVKKLKEDVSRIIGENYYDQKEIKSMKESLLDGSITLDEVYEDKLFELFNFNNRQLKELIEKNPINFEHLVWFKALNNEEIKEILGGMKKQNFDEAFPEFLLIRKSIEKSDVIKMYMNDNINVKKIQSIDEDYGIHEAITVEELVKFYFDKSKSAEDERNFDKYAYLFSNIILKGKTEEEKSEIAEEIVEELYKTDSEYDEDMKILYKSNLLPIRTLTDWNGEDIIYDLIQDNALKPQDAKSLLMTGELELSKAYTALMTSELSNTEKMNFILSSFDGNGESEEEIEAQIDARMYLMQALDISKEFSDFEPAMKELGTRTRGTSTTKRNEYISDPVYRWQLMSAIDEEYQTEVYLDGTVQFLLPNVNDGTVILEKMYKNTKGGVKMNYGSATYVMSQEEFLSNKKEIVQDGRINRKMLIEMKEYKKADKLIHSSKWGNALKNELNISTETAYTEEQMNKIDRLVDKIEKARELVD